MRISMIFYNTDGSSLSSFVIWSFVYSGLLLIFLKQSFDICPLLNKHAFCEYQIAVCVAWSCAITLNVYLSKNNNLLQNNLFFFGTQQSNERTPTFTLVKLQKLLVSRLQISFRCSKYSAVADVALWWQPSWLAEGLVLFPFRYSQLPCANGRTFLSGATIFRL